MTHAADLPPAERAYQQAHRNETKQPLYNGIYAMLYILAFSSTVLRLSARRISKLKLGPDDICSIIATLLFTGVFILNFQSTFLGKGRHDITITDAEWDEQAKNQFGANLLYTTTWPTIKMSILLLYRRIFIQRWFSVINWFMLTILSIYIVSTVLVDIFSCNPVDKTWNSAKPGHCINFTALYQVTAGGNVAIDLIILLMPQIPIWRLRMKRVERLGLALIYGIGIISCISSIMRIVTTSRVDNDDVNYQAVTPNIWTANELATSLMCANFPCVLPVVFKCNAKIRKLWISVSSGNRRSGTEMSHSSYPPGEKSGRVRDDRLASTTDSQTPSDQIQGLTPKDKTATIKTQARGGNQFDSLPEQENGVPHDGIGVEQVVKWNDDGKESTSSSRI